MLQPKRGCEGTDVGNNFFDGITLPACEGDTRIGRKSFNRWRRFHPLLLPAPIVILKN
jgi:hypothetical protein